MRWIALTAGVALGALGLAPGSVPATTFATARPAEQVLLANPAAEIGPGAAGWSGTLGYTTTAYGAPGEYPPVAVAESIAGGGQVGGGSRFFDPGDEPNAVLAQDVDLSGHAAQISSGELDALGVVAWLGGWEASPDTVDLVVTPLDGASAPLTLPTVLAGPTAAERGHVTSLVHRMAKVALPAATRRVRLELRASGQPGQKNHGGFGVGSSGRDVRR